jgi:hypothetical protein
MPVIRQQTPPNNVVEVLRAAEAAEESTITVTGRCRGGR